MRFPFFFIWKHINFNNFVLLSCYSYLFLMLFLINALLFSLKPFFWKQNFVDFNERQNLGNLAVQKNFESKYNLQAVWHLLPKHFSFELKDFWFHGNFKLMFSNSFYCQLSQFFFQKYIIYIKTLSFSIEKFLFNLLSREIFYLKSSNKNNTFNIGFICNDALLISVATSNVTDYF
jgi:hypothetical protein